MRSPQLPGTGTSVPAAWSSSSAIRRAPKGGRSPGIGFPVPLDLFSTSRLACGKRSKGTGTAIPGDRLPPFRAHPDRGQRPSLRDASSGAGKLLGLSREKIIGRSLDDFVEPSFKPQISELWQAFLQRGEQEGTLRLVGPDGSPREVEYTAKGNVLPVRHLLVLREKTVQTETEGRPEPTKATFRRGSRTTLSFC